jgi:hypothetical protein
MLARRLDALDYGSILWTTARLLDCGSIALDNGLARSTARQARRARRLDRLSTTGSIARLRLDRGRWRCAVRPLATWRPVEHRARRASEPVVKRRIASRSRAIERIEQPSERAVRPASRPRLSRHRLQRLAHARVSRTPSSVAPIGLKTDRGLMPRDDRGALAKPLTRGSSRTRAKARRGRSR